MLRAGVRVNPGRLALIAAANVPEVSVAARPRVSVVSTGDELVLAGSSLDHGQIVDSNRPMLMALVEAAGAELVGFGHVGDDGEALASLSTLGRGEPDLVLTTGGVSMGAYDTVKEVLSRTGTVEFTKVAMRPGMPQGAGRRRTRRTPIITLPGNPVSSLVSFHVFVPPGPARRWPASTPRARCIQAASPPEGWSSVPGQASEFTRVVLGATASGPPAARARTCSARWPRRTHLAVVDAGTTEIRPGDPVHLLPLVGQD